MRKYRRLSSLVLCLVLMASMALQASAAGNVVYLGKASGFIFAPGSRYSPTDLFSNLKNVMPGDSITDQVFIRNSALGVRLKVYMRALDAQDAPDQDNSDFLNQMTLTVKKGSNSILYNPPEIQTADPTDWVELGTINPGGKITLDLTLDVPIEMGNAFQNRVGYIDWEFKVEELPIISSPKTGDTFNMGLYVGLMAVSLGAVVILVILKRKKKNEE